MKNNRIRTISPTGVVETFAGSGTAGASGDGGQATAARLDQPTVVAVAPDNSVFLNGSKRLRKVTPNGVISTVLTVATFNGEYSNLSGLAFDAAGSAYLAQRHQITKRPRGDYASASVPIVTYTGSTGAYGGDGGEAAAARLNTPSTLAVDQDGSVYILENGRVRKIRNHPPRAALSCTPTQGYAPLTVTCAPTAGSFDPNGSIIAYAWKFGTRPASTTVKRVQQVYTFKTAGAYVVKLTVTDDAGVRATAEVTVTVR